MKAQESVDKELAGMRARAQERLAGLERQNRLKRVDDWDAFVRAIPCDLDLGERFRETVALWRQEE